MLLQTALVKHAAAYNLRNAMTFHQKVQGTAAFAEKLPQTAADLYAMCGSVCVIGACTLYDLLTAVHTWCGA